MHPMKSPLPSTGKAGGPPRHEALGGLLAGFTRVRPTVQPPRRPQPPPPHSPQGSSHPHLADSQRCHLPQMQNSFLPQPTIPALKRAVQRRSYVIASLQRKLDSQREESCSLQTKNKQLQMALFSLLEVWHELQSLKHPASTVSCDHASQYASSPTDDFARASQMPSGVSTAFVADHTCQQGAALACTSLHHCTSPQHPTPKQPFSPQQHPTPTPAATMHCSTTAPAPDPSPEVAFEFANAQFIYISGFAWWTSGNNIASVVVDSLGGTPFRMTLHEHAPNGKLLGVFVDVPTAESAQLLVREVDGKAINGCIWTAELCDTPMLEKRFGFSMEDAFPIHRELECAALHHSTSPQHYDGPTTTEYHKHYNQPTPLHQPNNICCSHATPATTWSCSGCQRGHMEGGAHLLSSSFCIIPTP